MTSVYLLDKALVIYISSLCGSVIMISVHHTTATWLLLVGVRILFVIDSSWRNTVEVDLDEYTFADIVLLVSIVLLLDIDWSMRLQSVDVGATNSTENKKNYVDTMCVSSGEVSRLLWIFTGVRPMFCNLACLISSTDDLN